MTWHVSAFAERPSRRAPHNCTVILPTLRMGARWPSVIVVRNRARPYSKFCCSAWVADAPSPDDTCQVSLSPSSLPHARDLPRPRADTLFGRGTRLYGAAAGANGAGGPPGRRARHALPVARASIGARPHSLADERDCVTLCVLLGACGRHCVRAESWWFFASCPTSHLRDACGGGRAQGGAA